MAPTGGQSYTARLKQNWTKYQEIKRGVTEAMLAEFRVREKGGKYTYVTKTSPCLLNGTVSK